MNFISMYFGKQITQIIEGQKYIDVRVTQSQLLTELSQPKAQKSLIKFIKLSGDTSKRLRILSILGLLMLQSDDFYQIIFEHLTEQPVLEEWIQKDILNPFAMWIKKCCGTSNLFKQIKKMGLNCLTFINRLPYTINILEDLLIIVREIPKFGRYFNLQKGNKLYIMFSQILMSLTNMIYSHLKRSLEQFLFNESQNNIDGHKEILKWVFNQVLPNANQTITNTSLCKHFKFYQRGIVTKMMKINEYSLKIQKIVKKIQDDQQVIQKCKSISTLESQIFPEDGTFNKSLFLLTLQDNITKPTKFGDITERSNRCTPKILAKKISMKSPRLYR